MKAAQLKQRTLAVACVSAFAMLSTSAVAGTIVTNWGYSTNATFTGATFEDDGDDTAVLPYELSWGAAGGDFQNPVTDFTQNRSALTIGSSSTVLTGGGPVVGFINTTFDGAVPNPLFGEVGFGVTFTHWNNPISSATDALLGGSVRDTLTLTPLSPAGGAFLAPTIDFEFKFSETTNDPAGDPGCAGGFDEPCPDLYGVVGLGVFNNSFDYDDITYFASIFVLGPDGAASPVGTLLNAECAVLGLDNGCLGFRTAENAVTTAQFAFSIGTERFPIPEPGTLALLGLGLAGLGVASRRRKV